MIKLKRCPIFSGPSSRKNLFTPKVRWRKKKKTAKDLFLLNLKAIQKDLKVQAKIEIAANKNKRPKRHFNMVWEKFKCITTFKTINI